MATDDQPIDDDVARFPCRDCGAKLEFQPGSDHLVCPWCGAENQIEGSAESVDEIDYVSMLETLEASEEHHELTTVKCDSCAAEVERPEKLTAFSCPFCGSDIVTREGSRKLLKPKSLMPFRIKREAANDHFRDWLGSLWFAPSELEKTARRDDRFQGIYLPYWTFDSETTSDYRGQRGEHYYVTETYTDRDAQGNTVTKTRQVQRTRWYPASGRVKLNFDDVLVAASQSLPAEQLEALEPWPLQDLLPFQESYLSGFKAETYQVELPAGFSRARDLMDPKIRAAICRDIGGDVQSISSCKTQHRNVTFKLVLLPVWLDAYRYRDKTFRVVINACTGEVQGERPYSVWKIVFLVLGILAAIGVVVAIVNLNQ